VKKRKEVEKKRKKNTLTTTVFASFIEIMKEV